MMNSSVVQRVAVENREEERTLCNVFLDNKRANCCFDCLAASRRAVFIYSSSGVADSHVSAGDVNVFHLGDNKIFCDKIDS